MTDAAPSEVLDAVKPGHSMEKTDSADMVNTYACTSCDEEVYQNLLFGNIWGPAVDRECAA